MAVEKAAKVANEAELAAKIVEGALKVKTDIDPKYPAYHRVKMEMPITGTTIRYTSKRYVKPDSEKKVIYVEMYNSLVDSINEYIDKHPELQNEPTMSFAEFKALAFDIIGKYNDDWRVHLDFTRTGKAKVAIQFHRPGYVPGEDGMDFKPMKKTKDDWYDEYAITTPTEALEKVLYKNREELLGSLKKAIGISCQLEEMAIRRSKEA